MKRAEWKWLVIGATLLCGVGSLSAADAGPARPGSDSSGPDARQLSGVWSVMPPGARGPGAAAPVRGAAAPETAGATSVPPPSPLIGPPPGPGAAPGPRPGGPLARSSTPPLVKSAYQQQFKPGEFAPHQGALRNNDASMLCVPDIFVGTGGGYPTLITQTRNQVTIVNEENHRFRRIYLDRPHPRKLVSSYAGHSIGHWEGNELIVDTVGLRERDGVKHPPGFRIVERFQKQPDGRSLRYTASFLSDAYETPGVNVMTWHLRPELRIQEEVCEEFSENFNEDYYK